MRNIRSMGRLKTGEKETWRVRINPLMPEKYLERTHAALNSLATSH